jgi:hypothetical protein
VPLIATEEDTGPFTKALVQAEPGKNLIAYRAYMSMDEYVDIISKVTGVKVKNQEVPVEVAMAGMPQDLAQEVSDNMNYVLEFGYEGRDDPSVVHPNQVSLRHVFE